MSKKEETVEKEKSLEKTIKETTKALKEQISQNNAMILKAQGALEVLLQITKGG
jgi:hypothetical protein